MSENKLVVYEAMILAIDKCYKVDEVRDISGTRCWRSKNTPVRRVM